MKRTRLYNMPTKIKTLADAVLVEDPKKILFISGQVGYDPSGKIPEGVEAQMRQALENLKAICEKAGGKFSDIVKRTIFLTNPEDLPKTRKVREEFYEKEGVREEDYPAGTACVVSSLGRKEYLVEIEAIAVIS
jgi:2-iminobutanoate/2-iminopropanoate deaminase